MLKRLFGRLVLVVVVVLGLWFVISHYHGNNEFGCQVRLVAVGGGNEACPATISQAATDARWAADRISLISDDPITIGLLYDEDGNEQKIGSGESGPAYEQAMTYLATYSTILGDQPRTARLVRRDRAVTIEARIGGDGTTVARLCASEPDDKVAMIDRYLDEHPSGVMFVEVKRDDVRSWDDWKDDPTCIEYMQVGVSGNRAAAQHSCSGLAGDHVVKATFNPLPSPAPSDVPYDEVLHWTFPAETVISLADVRQLMIDFVSTGEWAHRELWREHDHLVA